MDHEVKARKFYFVCHAQAIQRSDLHRSHYIGLIKTRLQYIFMVIALNMARAVE